MKKNHRHLKKIITFNNIWIFELVLSIIFCSFCFSQVIKISSGDYMASEFKAKITELSHHNKLLEVELSKNSSLEEAERLVDNSNFEKVGKVHYLRVSESTIVSK